jgi:hypothetical protein
MAKNKNIANLDSSFLEILVQNMTNQSVSEVFSHLLTESEKEKQEKTSKKIDKLDLRAETEDNKEQQEEEEDAEDTAAPEKDEPRAEVKAQKLPEAMDSEDVQKMLNIIRAGKSLKDPEIQERFDIWFGSLSPSEKIALKGFLDGIAEIIAGDIEAEEASKPSAPPYNVEMGSQPAEKPRKISAKKDSGGPSGEDSPIIVGEISDVSGIKKILLGN